MVKTYRESESSGNRSHPVPGLIETTQGAERVSVPASFWAGLVAISILIAGIFYWVSDWKAVLVMSACCYVAD